MSTFICVKTCGLFRQGKTYHFEKPTAQALSAARGGFLKPVAIGGTLVKPLVVVDEPAPLVVPKKRGRPKKQPFSNIVAEPGAFLDVVLDLMDP